MSRVRLVCCAAISGVLAVSLLAARAAPGTRNPSPVLMFLERHEPPVLTYRAWRRLEAETKRFKKQAWLEAITELKEDSWSYDILAAGGSEYVQKKVLVAALQAEQRLLRERPDGRFVEANYQMLDDGQEAASARIRVIPRRKDTLLVNGWLIVSPVDGELQEIRGTLAKTPSFWTTRVHVVRRLQRIAGVLVPVAMESEASVRVAGLSTFSMRYRYETLNGIRVSE